MESNRQDLVGATDMRGHSSMVNDKKKKKKKSPKWCYLGVIPKSFKAFPDFPGTLCVCSNPSSHCKSTFTKNIFYI